MTDAACEAPAPIRSLTLAYTFPFPPQGGYDLRVVNLARNLSGKIDQTLLCRSLAPLDAAAVEASREAFRNVEVLPLRRPDPLRKACKGAAFLAGPFPLRSAGFHFRPLARRLDGLLSAGNLDLVVMEGSWLCAYWPRISHCGARRVLDLHNIESEALARQAATPASALDRISKALDARRMARVEERMIGEADLVLVSSERERKVLIERASRPNVAVVPNGVDCTALRPLPPSDTREILFVGSFTYAPNVDAVTHFANDVFPQIRRELPGVVLRVIGRAPTARIRRLAGRDGIEITGEVDDIEPFYRRAAICIAPLRAGGGTRLKILEAMAYGRPVLSTRLGCEGLAVRHDRDIVIEDDPRRMAAAARALMEKGELRTRIASEARKLVEGIYDWRRIADGLLGHYREILRKPPRPGMDAGRGPSTAGAA